MDLVAVTVIHETVTQTDVNKMKTDASIDYLIQFQERLISPIEFISDWFQL